MADLIFPIPELIATISAGISLLPGDIIATGTPAGVGIGFDPPRFLEPGDVVECAIDKIGAIGIPFVGLVRRGGAAASCASHRWSVTAYVY